jgi:hypothetical protein
MSGFEQTEKFTPYYMEIMQPFKTKVYHSMADFEKELTMKPESITQTAAMERLVDIVTDLLSVEDYI